MQKLLKGALLLAAMVVSTQVLAAASVFDVEVVIIARQDNSTETWPPRPLPTDKTNPLLVNAISAQCPPPCSQIPTTIVGTSSDDTSLPRLLTSDELKLDDAASKLANLPGGRVLLHTGWRLAPKQPLYTQPMAIEAGRDLGGYVLSAPVSSSTLQQATSPVVTDAASQNVAAPAEPEGQVSGDMPANTQTLNVPAMVPELSGEIQVALDHYLLVDMALDLKTVQGDGKPLLVKTLRQKRRLKSGEWHYFDHPAMGVLMQIRPVK
ncbi:CsiV family protein [Gallaecimonas mangrovi]|uniref:CsiV family protein n=1 Tax=Gallaecimonas mangrovi TaxID=2291597 RepID=UPI0018664D1E|nr:CsiV family protein [Gallaecimonas mangrovi]